MVTGAFHIIITISIRVVLLLKEKRVEHHQLGQNKKFQNKVTRLGMDKYPFQLLGVLLRTLTLVLI